MTLLFQGELQFEVIQLADKEFKWIIHIPQDDGDDLVRTGKAISESDARLRLAMAISSTIKEW